MKTIKYLLLLVCIACLSSVPVRAGSKHKSDNSNTTRLFPATLTVEAGNYRYTTFTIPKHFTGHIRGRLEAAGGADNGIRVFITDEDGFTNIRNGHKATVWYNSDVVTVAKLDVQLGAGTYIIAVDNTNALVASRAIATDIWLELKQ